MFKWFLKQAVLYFLVALVLITLLQMLMYRGSCMLSDDICTEPQYLIQSVPWGLLYVCPALLALLISQTFIHKKRIAKGFIKK